MMSKSILALTIGALLAAGCSTESGDGAATNQTTTGAAAAASPAAAIPAGDWRTINRDLAATRSKGRLNHRT